MDAPKRSRENWIEAAFESLGEIGVDKVRVDQLATALGVTKGSFYWHFKDRSELLAAVVDGWEARGTEDIIREVERTGRDSQTRARHLWKLTSGGEGMRGELAIRDWARRDSAIAARVQQVDDRRMRYLEALFVDLGMPSNEVGPRALLVYSLLIGDYLIATSHAHRTRRKLVADALALVLRAR